MAKLSVLRSIRRFCLACQGNSSKAVQACADAACPLWAWRLPPAPEAEQAQQQGTALPLEQASLLAVCGQVMRPKASAPCGGVQPFSQKKSSGIARNTPPMLAVRWLPRRCAPMPR